MLLVDTTCGFLDYDVHGSFYDWVQILSNQEDDNTSYWPGKVILLYKFEDEYYCLVWMASTPTETECRHKTNINARWKMHFDAGGMARLSLVSMNELVQTSYVYEHFHHEGGQILPEVPVSVDRRNSDYVVNEVYDRYAWALNYLDEEQQW